MFFKGERVGRPKGGGGETNARTHTHSNPHESLPEDTTTTDNA